MLPFLLLSLRQNHAVAKAEYHDFLATSGLRPEMLVHRMLDTDAARPGDLHQYSGVFVGGSDLNLGQSPASAWQHAVNRQVAALLDSPVPVLTMCYGGSVLAAATGGFVGVTHPEKSGGTTVELTAAGRTGPIFGPLSTRFTALTGHTENITALGDAATLLATGPTCPVQAVRYGRHVWSCQFHGEMDAEAMAVRMGFFHGHGYFSDAEFAQIIAGLPRVDTSQPKALLRNFVAFAVQRASVAVAAR